MARKYLTVVSLLIAWILGLTACACRLSDAAVSVPANDKPAGTIANHRTTSDETAGESVSEESFEAVTESDRSEDMPTLIFPNPRSEQFELSERDAVLFDAAVAARDRTPNADICIPEIGIYGTYEEAGKTVIVCMCAIISIMAAMVRSIIRTAAPCRPRQKQCWMDRMVRCTACPLSWYRMVPEQACGQKRSVGH